jgi:hypothetical protein
LVDVPAEITPTSQAAAAAPDVAVPQLSDREVLERHLEVHESPPSISLCIMTWIVGTLGAWILVIAVVWALRSWL